MNQEKALRVPTLLLVAALHSAAALALQPVPTAVIADPPPDSKFPARMEVIHVPSGGVEINGVVYVASGQDPHPAFVFFHGLPGNEKNLDLAQSIRRAGWNAVFFDYRGSWGSPGAFSFSNSIEDTVAAIAYLRDPANTIRLRTDPKRIVLVGHSMGGFMAAWAGSHDPAILGVGLISAANMSDWAGGDIPADREVANRARLVKSLADNDILPLAGCTADSLADEMLSHRKQWNFVDYAPIFGARPLLLITSDDGLAAGAQHLAAALRQQGSTHITEVHFPTDHSYSDYRIALQAAVLNWLATLQ